MGTILAIFSDEVSWSGARAAIRKIAEYVRGRVPEHSSLGRAFSDAATRAAENYEAWSLEALGLDDCVALWVLVDEAMANQDSVLEWSGWGVQDFCRQDWPDFRAAVAARIHQLREGSRKPELDGKP